MGTELHSLSRLLEHDSAGPVKAAVCVEGPVSNDDGRFEHGWSVDKMLRQR